MRWQQTGRLRRKVLLVVVVVVKRKIFVFSMVCLVVFVAGIVQIHKIHDADFFLVAGDVMDKMMKKCAHFEEGLHSLACWRTGRQNLEGKEDGQIFFHFRGKGSRFNTAFYAAKSLGLIFNSSNIDLNSFRNCSLLY